MTRWIVYPNGVAMLYFCFGCHGIGLEIRILPGGDRCLDVPVPVPVSCSGLNDIFNDICLFIIY